jgi:hypothetical protein
VYRHGELGSLPREVADLVRVAARELQRDIATTLGLERSMLVIDD